MWKKLKKKTYDHYLKYSQEPIDNSLVLLEAGQGKNINGNMFALLREICENSRWSSLRPVFVVTKATMEQARERFAFYGFSPELVVRNTERYCQVLATAGILVTDNSFPPYFLKRQGQVYLNTWHGTPLKTLGKSELQNVKSMANLQKNYLMSDYALFPNTFTRDVFMKDYMLEYLYQGQVVLCDYPRNSIFLDQKHADQLKKKLQLQDKQVIAYMPTWRGANRQAQIEEQKQILQEYFSRIDSLLEDHQIFYVNLHFLVGDIMDYEEYRHIRPFPAEYETYDFLAVCDMLVTDYSSVFFDFAVTGKKIILFPYDLEEYLAERGTYMSMDSLPFPQVFSAEELVTEINRMEAAPDWGDFLDTYCAYRNPQVPEYLMELLAEHSDRHIQLETPPSDDRKLLMVYAGKMGNKYFNRYLLEELERLDQQKEFRVLPVFTGNFTAKIRDTLGQLPEGMNFLNLVSEHNFSRWERILAGLAIRNPWAARWADRKLETAYQREWERLFDQLEPERIVNFSGRPNYMYKIIARARGEKEIHIHQGVIPGLASESRNRRLMLNCIDKLYQRVWDHRQEDISRFWLEEEKENYYNPCIRMDNLFLRLRNRKDALCLRAVASVKTTLPFSLSELKIQVNDRIYPIQMKKGIRLGRRRRITTYRLEIPVADLSGFDVSNKVFAVRQGTDGLGLRVSIGYNSRRRDKRKWHKGPILFLPESDTSAYFRQSVKNRLYLAVRSHVPTDDSREQRKLALAYYVARLFPGKRRILLYEKNGSRYEESASVLYERLVDEGYTNLAFVLDRSYPFYDQVPDRYRKYLVDKCSFRHYLYFFRAKTFIGSETMVHSIDLRVDNKYAREKLASRNVNLVFLQHGVMYMVSLNSESRSFFKPKATRGKYRVVVSSQEEARHFTDLANYKPEQLYICGLPKYDRNTREVNADRIILMPTWRPWEYNEVRFDLKQTGYYQMLVRMFAAVPADMRDRVVILPHPLFFEAVGNEDFPLKKYMDSESRYDDILKHTAILVTDYSSIAYDAFYRGSNVIFYWEEKDACMEHYGPSTRLMLDEENTYGDICYSPEELTKALLANDGTGQKESYVNNYRKIVEFHDGKNTERLMEMLRADELLSEKDR